MKKIKNISIEELDQITNDEASSLNGSKGSSTSDKSIEDLPVSPTFRDVGDVGVTGRIYF